MDTPAPADKTKECPWCGETILAVAKKCKHCGEFLDANTGAPAEPLPDVQPRYRWDRYVWKCLAHDKAMCSICPSEFGLPPPTPLPQPPPQPKSAYSGTIGERDYLSTVGVKGAAGLACPKCGGTQFTAKRSMTGKVIGFSTLGVGGLLAPKSQVKCVACGTMFKRG